MKRIILSIAVFGGLGILAAPALAGDWPYPNIVHVNQYYHGGYHGNYHAGYHEVYRGHPGPYYGAAVVQGPITFWNWRGPTSIFPPPPPPLVGQPFYPTYYNPPEASFYYASPGLSIGVNF